MRTDARPDKRDDVSRHRGRESDAWSSRNFVIDMQISSG